MNAEQQVRIFEGDQYVASRLVPVSKTLITATTGGTAQTIWTVQDQKAFEVTRLVASNITSTAATLTLHAVPDGGSIGSGNAEIVGYSVAANTAVDITDLVQGLYPSGTTLQAWSGTTSALVVSGYGKELA